MPQFFPDIIEIQKDKGLIRSNWPCRMILIVMGFDVNDTEDRRADEKCKHRYVRGVTVWPSLSLSCLCVCLCVSP